MKSNFIVFPFYAVTAMLIVLASLGCELQHADGTTGSDDESAAETGQDDDQVEADSNCLLYTSPSPRDQRGSRMPSSA